jgi:quercetin dioxygenase-like cupin family protein
VGLLSAFDDVREIVPQQIWAGVVGRSVHGAGATLSVLTLEPNIEVPEHSHVNEQMGVLLQGSVTFHIGAEHKQLAPGATWVIPAHVPHSVDVGADGASIIELFAPARADWAGLERLAPGAPAGFGLD